VHSKTRSRDKVVYGSSRRAELSRRRRGAAFDERLH
jgi:hypothetical protein